MSSGELDERVTFRRKTQVQNAYGTLVETQADLTTVWAQVRPMSGQERDRGQQNEARSNYVVKVRNSSIIRDVTEKDIIIWRDHTMDIRFIPYAGPRPLYTEFEVERAT